MRCFLKFLVLLFATVWVVLLSRYACNRTVANESAERISEAVKVRYRSGAFERHLSLDHSDASRLSALIKEFKSSRSGWVKSVSLGRVVFLNGSDEVVLDAQVFKGKVVRIKNAYLELEDDLLEACGFGVGHEGK